jgi:nickel/cobalt exporter
MALTPCSRLPRKGTTRGVWLLVGAFLYGVLHAIGPGHGKFIVTTYLSTNQLAVARSDSVEHAVEKSAHQQPDAAAVLMVVQQQKESLTAARVVPFLGSLLQGVSAILFVFILAVGLNLCSRLPRKGTTRAAVRLS